MNFCCSTLCPAQEAHESHLAARRFGSPITLGGAFAFSERGIIATGFYEIAVSWYAVRMKVSAGLLMYRRRADQLEVLIAHPGSPIYRRKDAGHWTIPKGLVNAGEAILDAAQREFQEETGFAVELDAFIDLGTVRLKSGKTIYGFGFEGDADPAALNSNDFELEWPPRSGKMNRYPEIDQVRFVAPDEARRLLHPAQAAFIDRLEAALAQAE